MAHPPRRERDPAWCPRARVWTVDAWRRTIPAVAERVVVLSNAGPSEARGAVRTARGPRGQAGGAGTARRWGDGRRDGRGPSDGGGSDADTGWLSDDTGPEAEDEDDRRESSGAVSSSGVERRPPQRPPDEDEPTLEYRLLGAGVSSLLEEDVASCAAARENLFALGTRSGRVHVFSHAGDFVRARAPPPRRLSTAREKKTHAAPVTGVAFDARGEHVASCAADGTVSVARLGPATRRPARERSAADPDPGVSVVFAGEHDCAALAVALDPRETDAARRCVVVGLADGRLVVRTFASEPPGARGVRDESDFQSDFGDCTSVRDSAKTIFESRGEGPVRAVAWAGPCVAWANDRGVKIYDIAAQTPVAFIERPRGSPPPERYPPRLCWDGDATLLAGWADCVWVIAVSPRRDSAARRAEVLEQFQTEYVVAGIAPHGEDELAILAFLETPERDERGAASEKETTSTNRRVPPAFRPEMRVLRRRSAGAVETSRDALGVDGYAAFRPEEYALVSPSRERGFGGATDARSESASPPRLAYLLASPKALVAARARTRAERIAWFSSRGDFDAALELCDEDERFGGGDDANTKTRSSKTSRDAFVTAYVEHPCASAAFPTPTPTPTPTSTRSAKRCVACARVCSAATPRCGRSGCSASREARRSATRSSRPATIAPYVPTANPALSPKRTSSSYTRSSRPPRTTRGSWRRSRRGPGLLYGVAGIVSADGAVATRGKALSKKKGRRDPEHDRHLARSSGGAVPAGRPARARARRAPRPRAAERLGFRGEARSALARRRRRGRAGAERWRPSRCWTRTRRRRCSWTGGTSRRPELVAAHPRARRGGDDGGGRGPSRLSRGERERIATRSDRTVRARGGDLGARETYHLYLRRLFAVDKAACLRTATRRRRCSRSSTRKSSARSCATRPRRWTFTKRCASSSAARRRRARRLPTWRASTAFRRRLPRKTPKKSPKTTRKTTEKTKTSRSRPFIGGAASGSSHPSARLLSRLGATRAALASSWTPATSPARWR